MDAWVPDECSLPTADQPLRLAELDELFARSLHAQERVGRTQLRWWFAPGSAEVAAQLTAREAACCSFFTFRITVEELVRVDVAVPDEFVDVVDALEARAARGLRT